MFQFIVTNIFLVSVGSLLYLVARSLPRIDEDEIVRGSFLDRWAASEIPEKVDLILNNFLGKFLRKLKIFLLKTDNLLTKRLNKITKDNGNGKAKIDFKDIAGSRTVAESEKSDNN